MNGDANDLTEASQTKGAGLFTAFASGYLVLPNLIFLITWVRPWIGIPAALLAGWSWVRTVYGEPKAFRRRPLEPNTVIFAVSLGVIWTALAGAGGLVPQSMDYLKHNVLFHDLAHKDWPVTYDSPQTGHLYLCYSLAYYLVPSLGMRFLGDAWLAGLSFIWAAAGISLFFYWVATFRRLGMSFLIMFLLYAGAGVVWYVIKMEKIPGIPGWQGTRLGQPLIDAGLIHSYLDSFTKLQYTPQHAIAAWLGTALLYDSLWLRREPGGAGFVWASTLLWSPMSSAGLLLLPVLALRRIPWKRWLSGPNLAGGGILLGIMAVYYKGHLKMEFAGPIWKFAGDARWPVLYGLFLATQLLPVFFIFLADRKYALLKDHRELFLGAAVLLILLPLYRIGYNNDLRLQASTPALVITALAAGICLTSEAFSLRRPLFLALAASLCIGAIFPISRPIINLLTNKEDYAYAHTEQALGVHDITGVHNSAYNFGAQYLGDQQSPAYRCLLKQRQ